MSREYFRILAPFNDIKDVKLLKQAGADELYCGYVTEELTKNWPLAFLTINRRGQGRSFENYRVFRRALKSAGECGLPVYVTVNGLYTSEQYPLLIDLVKRLESLPQVSGIIIADFGLLLTLNKIGFSKEIHISAGGTCFNSNTADFYHSLGANRVILPRQLTSGEIKDTIQALKSNIDTEIFIVNEGCGGLIDGYCMFYHCFQPGLKEKVNKGTFLVSTYDPDQVPQGCTFYFNDALSNNKFRVFNAVTYKEKKLDLRFQSKKYELYGCRICSLYQLKDCPIRSLKIIGRGGKLKKTIKTIRLLRKVLAYLQDETISQNDFRKRCRKSFSRVILNNERRCTKFDCYFSSHWVKHENQV